MKRLLLLFSFALILTTTAIFASNAKEFIGEGHKLGDDDSGRGCSFRVSFPDFSNGQSQLGMVVAIIVVGGGIVPYILYSTFFAITTIETNPSTLAPSLTEVLITDAGSAIAAGVATPIIIAIGTIGLVAATAWLGLYWNNLKKFFFKEKAILVRNRWSNTQKQLSKSIKSMHVPTTTQIGLITAVNIAALGAFYIKQGKNAKKKKAK